MGRAWFRVVDRRSCRNQRQATEEIRKLLRKGEGPNTLFKSHIGVIMKAARFALLAFIGTLSLAPLSLSAQEPQHHHDVDEKLGTVSFATSCAPAVQSQFERGVALLHSFEYEVAEGMQKCDAALELGLNGGSAGSGE